MTMKRTICIVLILLLLCGCTPAAETTASSTASASELTVPANAQTVPAATEAALAGPEDLNADSVLLYRQEDFKAREGTLFSLEELRAAPEEALLPRTHIYDERFPGDGVMLLRLLDYCLANGYVGFSVPEGTVPLPAGEQFKLLEFMYRIDGGKVNALTKDGVTTVWYKCRADRSDTMEKFSEGLAAARRIAAEAPRGDEWETVSWIFYYLGDHVSYGDRDTYYLYHGYHLHDALVEGSCVCSGYSDAMYYLCNLCGVECLSVWGLATSDLIPGGIDGHAWNCARINDLWYCFDPTGFAVSPRTVYPIFFGIPSFALSIIGGHRLTGDYDNNALIPACESSFDPVTVWNGTPEGALKSWLWYAAQAETFPANLLLCSGLGNAETQYVLLEDGSAATDLPYETFYAWTLRFMSEDCAARFIPAIFRRTEEGGVSLRLPAQSDLNLNSLIVDSFTENADGSRTADLGAASAVFTVSQNDDGLYRIESIELTPKE